FVPFSCKQRGLCPSCGCRRMCEEAATITDRILPNVPIRQYVLSLPFELRGLAATKPDVLTAIGRIFAEEIARMTKRLAAVAVAETGAISFPQRFGGKPQPSRPLPHVGGRCGLRQGWRRRARARSAACVERRARRACRARHRGLRCDPAYRA